MGLAHTADRLVLIMTLLAVPATVLSASSSDAVTSAPTAASDPGVTAASTHSICTGHFDIRNHVSGLKKIQGCRVIDGSLQIVLIDHANETDYEMWSFPELREITHYLLFYRVSGLLNIGQLFPNLALIRGNSLFEDYAFVIYEMFHLEEVGLSSLAEISHGAVRIEKNPRLCFLDTINWELIAKWDLEKNYISHNQDPADCPGSAVCRKAGCPMDLCWNSDFCQIHYNDTYKNCDPQCLGGCSGPGPMACHSCRNYLTLSNECVETCPDGTYLLQGRRCVTQEYCFTLKDRSSELTRNFHFLIFNGSCIASCPPGFEITPNKESCEKCQKGKCKKVCPGVNIDNVVEAQNLIGCTYINGSLEISIKQGKHQTVAYELEESFKLIEEISGSLKISRSFPLVNLKFFKSLETIHGRKRFLENGKYSLIVLDNQNLQELWDIKSTFRILNGRIFFHYNPKLCHHYIESLIITSGLTNVTSYEVDLESNGDKFACNTTQVDLIFTKVTSTDVLMKIILPNSTIPRPSLHRFAVHFTESEITNLTVFEEDSDECGDSRWRVGDVMLEYGQFVTAIQTQLKPFTQYAFYVKTYTVHSTAGKSPIYYVRTLPSIPSDLTVTLAYSNESSTIVLQWTPPRNPNGLISEYIITGFWQRDDRAVLDLRDYCRYPMEEETLEVLPIDLLTNVENDTNSCCYENQITYRPKGSFISLCDNSRIGLLPMKNQVEDNSITCNKYFYETVYKDISLITEKPKEIKDEKIVIKKSKFQKRDDRVQSHTLDGEDNKKFHSKRLVNTRRKQGLTIYKVANNDSNGYVINNLHHYTKYTIMVRVCREKLGDEENDEYRCSKPEMVTVRTLKKDVADIIDNNGVFHEILEEDDDTVLLILWEEPIDPNGLVVAFQIEHRRSDLENAKAVTECITHAAYIQNKKRYALRGLIPGKYIFRLRTVSLAGPGIYTDPFDFEIKHSRHGYYYSLLILFIVLLVLISIGSIYYYYILVRRESRLDLDLLLTSISNEDTISHTTPPDVGDSWEIERENVEIVKEIAQGSFGKVYKGILKPGKVSCAIKALIDEDHTSAFWNEITVMKQAAEVPHIVRLLGIVTRTSPQLVVMELLALGDLKTFLRSTRAQPPLSLTVLQMAAQIADAMIFMEMNRFVHRDLAARNCMVHEDHTVKVGDFGLIRHVYTTDYYKKGDDGLLPIRWMAPESLRDGVFTSRSDVWSYGVVLWEIATLAEQPYLGLNNEQVLHQVIEGETLVPPESCAKLLKDIMALCWNKSPVLRPSFRRITAKLDAHVGNEFKCTSYYHKTVLASESGADDIIVCDSDDREPQVSLIH